MGRHRKLLVGVCVVVLAVAAGSSAIQAKRVAPKADAKYAPIRTATLSQVITPEHGFVDNPFSFDQSGSRLIYVETDAGTSSHAVVVDTLQRTELFRVNLGQFTLKPERVDFALNGEHVLVWSLDEATGKKRVALLDAKGKVIRQFGPATDIVKTQYQGEEAIVVHDVSPLKRKKTKKPEDQKGQPIVRHTVSVFAVDSGKSLGKKTNLDLDENDKSPELDFTFKYWAQDFTVAVGIKGGEWDRKEDQRSPDSEGWYDMPNATFSKRLPIQNIVEHRERMEKLVKYSMWSRDVVARHDLTGIDFVQNGEFTSIELAAPFHHYDHTSVVTQHSTSGSIFFTMTIDPVHPDAAARRRAVKPWMDLYEYDPTTKKATRRARFLPPKGRRHTWRATSTHWAIVPMHVGFDRGGTKVLLYSLQ